MNYSLQTCTSQICLQNVLKKKKSLAMCLFKQNLCNMTACYADPFQAPSFNGTLVSTLTDADTTQAPHGNCTLDNTLLSSVTATSTSSDNSTALNSTVLREVMQHIFVPGIGWASQLGNGEIWVKFMDGTQLGMKSSATTITYIDTAGKVTK